MNDVLKYLNSIQYYITYNSFYSIPLDIISHLVIGVLLTIVLFKIGFRHTTIIIMIFALSFSKEIYDHQVRGDINFLESLKDILISISYPCFKWLQNKIRKLKNLKDQD